MSDMVEMRHSDAYNIAECACMVLRHEKHRLLRRPAIDALRFLWRNGDAMQRHLVAARILIWLGRVDQSTRREIADRIYHRELTRQLRRAA